MKVALIFYGGFLHKAGGAFFHARNIESEICRMGWKAECITLNSLPIWCRYLPHTVERIVNSVYAPFGFLYKAYITKLLYKHYFSQNVDLRIFEDIYITWDSSIPSISILHAVLSDNLQAFSVNHKRQKKFREVEAQIINEIVQPVATVSYPYREYMIEDHFAGLLTKNIDVIESGIDQSKFINVDEIERVKKSIIYTGALESRKNIFFLLRLFKKLYEADSEYKLTIIGDGPDRGPLTAFAEKNNLPVRFLGRVDNNKVLSELYCHEIYIHTSVKESFSYSLLEAKIAGLMTCAYAKLQIPSEFIDVGFETFCVDEWCSGILNIDAEFNGFDGSKYTSERMTRSTLDLISNV